MEPLYFQGRILKLGLKVTVIQTLGKTKKVWIFFFLLKDKHGKRNSALEQHRLPDQELVR